MKKLLFFLLILIASSCGDEQVNTSLPEDPGVNSPNITFLPYDQQLQSDDARAQTCAGQGQYLFTWTRTHNNYPTSNPSSYTTSVYATGGTLNGCSGVSSATQMWHEDGALNYASDIEFVLSKQDAASAPFNYTINRGRGYNVLTGTLTGTQSRTFKVRLPVNYVPGMTVPSVTYVLTPQCPYSPMTISHQLSFNVINCMTPQTWPVYTPTGAPHNFNQAQLFYTCP